MKKYLLFILFSAPCIYSTKMMDYTPVSPYVKNIIRTVYEYFKMTQETESMQLMISNEGCMVPASDVADNGNIYSNTGGVFLTLATDQFDNADYLILSPAMHKILELCSVEYEDASFCLRTSILMSFSLLQIAEKRKVINENAQISIHETSLNKYASKKALKRMSRIHLIEFQQQLQKTDFATVANFLDITSLIQEELAQRKD